MPAPAALHRLPERGDRGGLPSGFARVRLHAEYVAPSYVTTSPVAYAVHAAQGFAAAHCAAETSSVRLLALSGPAVEAVQAAIEEARTRRTGQLPARVAWRAMSELSFADGGEVRGAALRNRDASACARPNRAAFPRRARRACGASRSAGSHPGCRPGSRRSPLRSDRGARRARATSRVELYSAMARHGRCTATD